MESIRGRCGSKCGRCRVDVGSMWDRCRVDVGSMESRWEVDVFVDGKIYRINEEVEEGNKKH